MIARTKIEEFTEEELALYEKFGPDEILNHTEVCKTTITEEDSQEEELHSSSIKYESTANSTVKSSDLHGKAQNMEINIPDYLITEKVEEACFPLEEGSALLKDLHPLRESSLNRTLCQKSAQNKYFSDVKNKVTSKVNSGLRRSRIG